LGNGPEVTSPPIAEPLPFCREIFGAILVQIWTKGMVAAGERETRIEYSGSFKPKKIGSGE
jgi:hypothetical protein